MTNIIIITDLDGTLLHPVSYSFEDAIPALAEVHEANIPVVLCSSKTKAEIEVYRRLLNNCEPFISENGGGIFIPEGYFANQVQDRKADELIMSEALTKGKEKGSILRQAQDDNMGVREPCHGELVEPFSNHDAHESWNTVFLGGYTVTILGKPYSVIREIFQDIRNKTGIRVKGFGDMSTEDVALLTGMQLSDAGLSKERDFDEPFIFEEGENRITECLDAIEHAELHWTQGRFYHILGDNDKGKAVKILMDYYKRAQDSVVTIGLGDSFNDLPLLHNVDYPVLVQKEDGSYEERIKLQNIIRADGIGPAGWNREIIKLIRRIRENEIIINGDK